MAIKLLQTDNKILLILRGRDNKAYTLNVGSVKIPVYCQMTGVGFGACAGGGWTLVMKTDGTKV